MIYFGSLHHFTRTPPHKKFRRLCFLFLLFCLITTSIYLTVGYGAFLDSDMSSELVLAQHLAQERTFVSATWHYSTEVRLLSTQLIFMPLMTLFGDNWQLVRALGCTIMLALLSLSSYFAARSIGAKSSYAAIAAGLSVCVCSPLYAQNVIIGAYYIPHAVLSLVSMGLCARLVRGGQHARLLAGILLALSLAMGICSERYLLQIIAPITGSVLFLYIFPATAQESPRTKHQHLLALYSLLLLLFGGIGYLLMQKVLANLVNGNFGYYGSATFANWTRVDLSEQIQNVLFGLLSTLGFEGGVPLLSASGMANVMILLEITLFLLLTVRAFRCETAEECRFGLLMCLFCALLSSSIFILLRSVYFDRYWLMVVMICPPVLALCLSTERNTVLRRAAVALVLSTTLLTSAMCIVNSMRYPQVRSELRFLVLDAVQEHGLTRGYATFWNANILTELTDGEVDVTALKMTEDADGIAGMKPHRWLEATDDFEADCPDNPVFLLLDLWEEAALESFLGGIQAEKIPLDGEISMYLIPSQQQLLSALDPD